MPYKRGYKNKVRKPVSKATQVFNIASKALTTALQVKKLLNVEFKFHDVSANGTAITNTGIIIPLTNLAQGDTDDTRDGATIKLKSIEANFIFKLNASATASVVRTMIVIDTQTNQVGPTLANVLADAGNQTNLVSPRNLDNRSRFIILKDFNLLLDASYDRKQKSWYKKMNLHLVYDSNAGSISDLTSNSLTLFFMGSEGTNYPEVSYYVRSRYIDN